MCGIAGLIDLTSSQRPVPNGVLPAMAKALTHRGPDEDGFFVAPGIGLASRRLSIVGLHNGRQPVGNEDGHIQVVMNGEIFEYPSLRHDLQLKGHRLVRDCDTEVIPHLWEDLGEKMFDHLQGQFALALWDAQQRRLLLARDRAGIAPLFWTRQKDANGEWLLFASEIKALLASGMVPARADRRGIDHVFTMLAVPGPITCFAGVQALVQGQYLDIQLRHAGDPAHVRNRTYWQLDFPERGQEENPTDPKAHVDRFEQLLLQAIERRLRADVPVVAYLSGGIDSSLVVKMASHIRKQPIPTFTVAIRAEGYDESGQAETFARSLGTEHVTLSCGAAEIGGAYSRLIEAAECPVSDTCRGAILLLAQEVHQRGYKVVLTGEGSDEALGGYPWFKWNKIFSQLDRIPGVPLSQLARRLVMRFTSRGNRVPWQLMRYMYRIVGNHNAWLDMYGHTNRYKRRVYSESMLDELKHYIPYQDLGIDVPQHLRWHPFHDSVWWGYRVNLPGLLLSSAGDRVTMHSSVEGRYPFLDEDVVAFLAKVHPDWKLRGLREKYLLRLLGERWLPHEMAWRRKGIFQAPFDIILAKDSPAYFKQLISHESLRKTGYFDPATVDWIRRSYRQARPRSLRRIPFEVTLSAVVSTQLWHHLYIDGTLADLPSRATSASRPNAQ